MVFLSFYHIDKSPQKQIVIFMRAVLSKPVSGVKPMQNPPAKVRSHIRLSIHVN